ncbi:MAG: hypothetical protein PGN13_04895 [Patulibacter minatonensis]
MDYFVPIVFIVLGLIGMTPAGARLSMRMNDAPGGGGQGYRPKTVPAMRIVSAIVFVVGVAALIVVVGNGGGK